MKKKVVICLGLAMLMLTACGKRAECEFCEEKAWCETTEVNDEEVDACKDCMERIHDCDWCGKENTCLLTQVFGKKLYICDDCIDTIQNGFN